MRSKFKWFLLSFMMVMIQLTFAQDRTVNGIVKGSDGLPVPGVSVLVKGTSTGTETDFDGKYSIKATATQTLVFSYIGTKTQEKLASATKMDVTLIDSEEQLEGIVVTALGIKKEKKALGYASTSLTSADLEDRANGDISRILMGKAAGVNVVNASGLSGSGTSINIRGLAGLGDNQPLVVIDGVRFNSSTTGSGFSSTSRFADIDPNNIESLNVLKGLSAAALYGTDGRNGVIVITTKSSGVTGKAKKTEITYNSSVVFNEMASLPDFTNERGQGYYNAYFDYDGNWGATFGQWANYNNINANGQILHPYRVHPAFQSGFPSQVTSRVDYRNYKSQENFFRTGAAYNNNISLSGGSKDSSFNLFVGNLDDTSFMPGNSYKRNHISVGGSSNLSNKFSISGTLNYTNVRSNFPFTNSIINRLFNTPRSIDLEGWPSQHPLTGEEISYRTTLRNPYWILNNAGVREDVNRFYGQLSATFKFNESLNAVYRFGLDKTITNSVDFENRGAIGNPLGDMNTLNVNRQIHNHTLMINYDKRFFSENFGVSANAGIDIAQNKGYFTNTSSTEQQLFGLFEHQFFTNHTAGSGQFTLNRPGVFTQFTLDWKKYLYLNLSGRKEWTSNFVDNSLIYPGASLSFVLTEAFPVIKGKALSFLKLRTGLGSSADFNAGSQTVFGGNFAPYPLTQAVGFNSNAFDRPGVGIVAVNSLSADLANRQLRPALIKELEFGLESKFFNNRFSFDATFFERTTEGLIFPRTIDPSTGFNSTFVNVNEFKIWGLEIEANLKLIDKEKMKWSIGGNFTRIRSEVTEIDVDRFQFTSFQGGAFGNYLIQGRPINMIYGYGLDRDPQGRFIIDPSRNQIRRTNDIVELGDPTPEFTVSGFTAFEYKNFTLTGNVQFTKGGSVYLGPAVTLLGRGLTTDNDGNQNTIYNIPGVFENNVGGQLQYTPTSLITNIGDYHFNHYLGGQSSDEIGIFDGTFIRLQEIALTYSVPAKLLKNTPFGNVTFGFVGENLYMHAFNVPKGINVDLNSVGGGVNSNVQGFVANNGPSARRFGFTLKLMF